MKLVQIANEYVSINVFNSFTAEKMRYVAKLFDERSGLLDIQDLTEVHLGQYKAETLKKVKLITYNGYLGYLKVLGNYCVERGYLTYNMFTVLKSASTPRFKAKLISNTDLAKATKTLVAHAYCYDPAWFWLIVMRFLYFTGVRRRQLVSIQIGDIDLKNKTLELRSEGSKTLREWVIPVSDDLMDDINEVLTRSAAALGRDLRDDDPLFNITWFNPRYEPDREAPKLMNVASITGFFKRLSKRSGVQIGAHRFRHTIATRLCNPEQGQPNIFAVQDLLGHTDIKTTKGYVTSQLVHLKHVVNTIQYPT